MTPCLPPNLLKKRGTKTKDLSRRYQASPGFKSESPETRSEELLWESLRFVKEEGEKKKRGINHRVLQKTMEDIKKQKKLSILSSQDPCPH